ncbi:MAG: sensor histidine kinase [Sulfuricella sp.]|jgi:two-component sensor histidine kinase|nr:sensor histidine kinase [Sulfuricella sp.]
MLLHQAHDNDHTDDSLSLRDTVVREVHHRIKNHLQGVAGLLRQHADEHPEIRPIMDTAIAQIRAVAAIHGLQGKKAGSRVSLCDMVSSIAGTVGDLTNAQIVPSIMADSAMPAQISESEAVAIALILNELVMNAVKHSPTSEDSRKIVRIGVTSARKAAQVRIFNQGKLPLGFNFECSQETGNGLSLVHSLLPLEGASLRIMAANGGVETVMDLSPPIVMLH